MTPLRQCPFCKVWQSRLSRHISTVHKSETQVKEILKTSTTSTQRIKQLAVFRKEGIFNENVFQATQPEPTYERERKGLSALSCCSRCKGFYSSKQYHKHKDSCKGNTDDILSSVGVDAFKTMKMNLPLKSWPNFTMMTSENCAALSQRLFSLVGDVFNETLKRNLGGITCTQNPPQAMDYYKCEPD